ncbi:MAG: cyclic nucleotide-binding/CBS domain-containing protein [archaeon]
MQVRDLMTEGAVSIERDASLQRAIGAMIQNGIGSVLVVENDRPVGILTDTDVLRAMYLAKSAPPDVPVEREMTTPLVTIAPDESIEAALAVMERESIKKLPVEENVTVVGMLTLTDLAFERPELVEEMDDVGEQNGE